MSNSPFAGHDLLLAGFHLGILSWGGEGYDRVAEGHGEGEGAVCGARSKKYSQFLDLNNMLHLIFSPSQALIG